MTNAEKFIEMMNEKMESELKPSADLPRKYIANIAAMYGVKPGRMGKERLCEAVSLKIKCMNEESLREATKPTPELMK